MSFVWILYPFWMGSRKWHTRLLPLEFFQIEIEIELFAVIVLCVYFNKLEKLLFKWHMSSKMEFSTFTSVISFGCVQYTNAYMYYSHDARQQHRNVHQWPQLITFLFLIHVCVLQYQFVFIIACKNIMCGWINICCTHVWCVSFLYNEIDWNARNVAQRIH